MRDGEQLAEQAKICHWPPKRPEQFFQTQTFLVSIFSNDEKAIANGIVVVEHPGNSMRLAKISVLAENRKDSEKKRLWYPPCTLH